MPAIISNSDYIVNRIPVPLGGHHPPMEFGRRLAAIRKSRKVTQAALASAVNPGAKQNWVSNFETGKHYPSVPDIYELAKHLKCHPGELFADLPPVSQSVRLDGKTITAGVELAKQAVEAKGMDDFNLTDDAEIVAAAIDYLRDNHVDSVTDSVVLAFMRRKGNGGQTGQAGGAHRAEGGKEAGGEGQASGDRQRKFAAGNS